MQLRVLLVLVLLPLRQLLLQLLLLLLTFQKAKHGGPLKGGFHGKARKGACRFFARRDNLGSEVVGGEHGTAAAETINFKPIKLDVFQADSSCRNAATDTERGEALALSMKALRPQPHPCREKNCYRPSPNDRNLISKTAMTYTRYTCI